jgi:hypothetical protein
MNFGHTELIRHHRLLEQKVAQACLTNSFSFGRFQRAHDWPVHRAQ